MQTDHQEMEPVKRHKQTRDVSGGRLAAQENKKDGQSVCKPTTESSLKGSAEQNLKAVLCLLLLWVRLVLQAH